MTVTDVSPARVGRRVGGPDRRPWTDGAVQALNRLLALPANEPGRPRARDRAVEAWLPLADRLARRYSGRSLPLEDLVQSARLGLVKAVDGFDPTLGEDFVGYAAPTIVGELKRLFRDRSWALRMPRRLQDLCLQVTDARQVLTQRLSRSPGLGEIADHLRIPERQVREAAEAAAAHSCVSLHSRCRAGDGEAELLEFLGDLDPAFDELDDKMVVDGLLRRLPLRERRVLAMRFYGNQTQDEIAARVGISQIHVSRLLNKSLTWLRDQITDEG